MTTYPNAHLFPALGSVTGASLDKVREYTQAAIEARKTAGDTKITFVEFAVQNAGADGVGCAKHPSLETHAKMAAVLASAPKTTLDWWGSIVEE